MKRLRWRTIVAPNFRLALLGSIGCPPEGGRYMSRSAFPLAFAGQNDIFSRSSDHRKIIGQESACLALHSTRVAQSQRPRERLKIWGGWDEEDRSGTGILCVCAARVVRTGTGYSV